MSMNYRQAVKLVAENGGAFLKHGRSHDIFVMPWGTEVPIPRHKKDFSPGTEDDIRKRAAGKRR